MSFNKPNGNFREKLMNKIQTNRKLNSKSPEKPHFSPTNHSEDELFFNSFEKDIEAYRSFKNKINMNKIPARSLTNNQKQFLSDQFKIHLAEEILAEKEVFEKNEDLMKNIEKIKRMNLFHPKDLHIRRYKSTGKSSYVMNDYHTRSTNPGFSRNKLGNFFTN